MFTRSRAIALDQAVRVGEHWRDFCAPAEHVEITKLAKTHGLDFQSLVTRVAAGEITIPNDPTAHITAVDLENS